MSLGIAFKGAEGIVLAADSRVTLMAMIVRPAPGPAQAAAVPQQVVPATFDNATKLLRVAGQKFVGAVTYGAGAIGQQQPRTAHSFIPEFDAELMKKHGGVKRLTVRSFAEELSEFFMRQWRAQGMPVPAPPGADMVFLVGGYDEGEPYGRIFEMYIPSSPDPAERHAGEFGIIWGGQREYTDRLITGFDPNLPGVLQEILRPVLNLTDAQRDTLYEQLRHRQIIIA